MAWAIGLMSPEEIAALEARGYEEIVPFPDAARIGAWGADALDEEIEEDKQRAESNLPPRELKYMMMWVDCDVADFLEPSEPRTACSVIIAKNDLVQSATRIYGKDDTETTRNAEGLLMQVVLHYSPDTSDEDKEAILDNGYADIPEGSVLILWDTFAYPADDFNLEDIL